MQVKLRLPGTVPTLVVLCGFALIAVGQEQAEQEAAQPDSVSIAKKRRASIEDGYRLMAKLARQQRRIPADTDIEGMGFDDLQELLISLEVVDPSWAFDPAAGLERDMLAFMVAGYLDIRPGLLTALFGKTRRYAFRELQHRGLMVQGQPRQVVSGSELLSVLTRAVAETDRRAGILE